MNQIWYPLVALVCPVSMRLMMLWMMRGRRRSDRERPTGGHESRRAGDAPARDPDGVGQPSPGRAGR